MKGNKSGFTLVEMLVVVLIIGILSTMGVTYYAKTVENSKAQDAVAVGQMLATAHKMYLMDNPGKPLGATTMNDSCDSNCSSAAGICKLPACGYIAKQKWNSAAYEYTAGDGVSILVKVTRRTGNTPGTDKTPYSKWGYEFDASGGCRELSDDAPKCPSF